MPKKDADSRQCSFKIESAMSTVKGESSIASVSNKAELSASASSNQQQDTDDGNSECVSYSILFPQSSVFTNLFF